MLVKIFMLFKDVIGPDEWVVLVKIFMLFKDVIGPDELVNKIIQ